MSSMATGGPLSEAEVRELDSTLLPALERHHLRLLAHGLRSLQAAAGRCHGPLPESDTVRRWALTQPQVAQAPGFAEAFTAQLQTLGHQLETIAAGHHCGPLALTLEQLVHWARSQADGRIERPGSSAEAPAPASAHQQPHPENAQ